jgi:hypothetical protein
MLVIALLGTICGAEGWTEIVGFGFAKQEWLKKFLPRNLRSIALMENVSLLCFMVACCIIVLHSTRTPA